MQTMIINAESAAMSILTMVAGTEMEMEMETPAMTMTMTTLTQ